MSSSCHLILFLDEIKQQRIADFFGFSSVESLLTCCEIYDKLDQQQRSHQENSDDNTNNRQLRGGKQSRTNVFGNAEASRVRFFSDSWMEYLTLKCVWNAQTTLTAISSTSNVKNTNKNTTNYNCNITIEERCFSRTATTSNTNNSIQDHHHIEENTNNKREDFEADVRKLYSNKYLVGKFMREKLFLLESNSDEGEFLKQHQNNNRDNANLARFYQDDFYLTNLFIALLFISSREHAFALSASSSKKDCFNSTSFCVFPASTSDQSSVSNRVGFMKSMKAFCAFKLWVLSTLLMSPNNNKNQSRNNNSSNHDQECEIMMNDPQQFAPQELVKTGKNIFISWFNTIHRNSAAVAVDSSIQEHKRISISPHLAESLKELKRIAMDKEISNRRIPRSEHMALFSSNCNNNNSNNNENNSARNSSLRSTAVLGSLLLEDKSQIPHIVRRPGRDPKNIDDHHDFILCYPDLRQLLARLVRSTLQQFGGGQDLLGLFELDLSGLDALRAKVVFPPNALPPMRIVPEGYVEDLMSEIDEWKKKHQEVVAKMREEMTERKESGTRRQREEGDDDDEKKERKEDNAKRKKREKRNQDVKPSSQKVPKRWTYKEKSDGQERQNNDDGQDASAASSKSSSSSSHTQTSRFSSSLSPDSSSASTHSSRSASSASSIASSSLNFSPTGSDDDNDQINEKKRSKKTREQKKQAIQKNNNDDDENNNNNLRQFIQHQQKPQEIVAASSQLWLAQYRQQQQEQREKERQEYQQHIMMTQLQQLMQNNGGGGRPNAMMSMMMMQHQQQQQQQQNRSNNGTNTNNANFHHHQHQQQRFPAQRMNQNNSNNIAGAHPTSFQHSYHHHNHHHHHHHQPYRRY